MTRMQDQDWVHPLEIHHNLDTDEFFVLVEFTDVMGKRRTAVLPRGQIDDPRGARRRLASMGADIPDNWHDALKAALAARGCKVVRSTAIMGWRDGEAYLLPDGAIGKRRGVRPIKPAEPDRCAGGKASAWRHGLASACAASSYLTFAVAVGFSGSLLRPLGQDESAVFHFFGESSTGKSLAALAAQSVIEKAGREHMRSHDLTDRALEEEAAACNDSLFVLDEAGRVEGTAGRRLQHMQRLAYKLCGGQGRRRSQRAVSDLALHNVQYLILGISSGEEPLDGNSIRKRNDGEQVRLIGIPVPSRQEGGVFDHEKSGEQRTLLARQVEESICAHYGRPIRRFIRKLLEEDNAVAKGTEYMERFMRKSRSSTSPFAERFARKFAVVYAGAMLAADFNLAPWTKKEAGRAIRKVYRRAWAIVRPPASTADDLLAWLRTHASDDALFPEVAQGEKVSSRAADSLYGIRRDLSRRPVLGLLRDQLPKLVPPGQAREVEALLAAGGFILPGKEHGRHVRQLRVKGLQLARPDFLLFDMAMLLGEPSGSEADSDAA